jgi:phosphoglycolate phosphatase/pyrophosphatase PpaX
MLKCLLFDLDGTLVNSLAVTFEAFNYVFQKFGGRAHTPSEIMAYFGPGEREIFGRVLGEETKEEARSAYFEYTRSRMAMAPLFPGIDPLLATCRERGISVGVVTGRGRESTDYILGHHGLRERFGSIITHDDVASSKPSPEGILKALSEMGFKPEEAAYVGDMWMDVQAAHRAGCLAISAGWDVSHDRKACEREEPARFFEHPSKLDAWLKG